MTFTDGSKYEHFSKVVLSLILTCVSFNCHFHRSLSLFFSLFEEKTSGYLLLKVLRCYLEIDMFASLQVHTEHIIAAGKLQITRFYSLLVRKLDLSQLCFSLNFLFSYVFCNFLLCFPLLTYSQSFFSLSADYPRHSR